MNVGYFALMLCRVNTPFKSNNLHLKLFIIVTVLLVITTSPKVTAQARTGIQQALDGFELNASLAAEDVTNANRQAKSQLPINEYQWRPKLAANGVLMGRLSRFEIDGSYELRRHSEQKQQNTALFLGDTTLFIGTDSSRFSAELGYSAQELLIDPLQGDAPNNLDRRNIATATGYMHLGQPQSQWELNIHRSTVTFDVSRLSNSKRQGGGVNYSRAVSRVSRLGIDVSGYQLEYERPLNGEAPSFDYARAALSWSTKLKRLAYSLSAGRNSVGDELSETSPFYDVAISYTGHLNSFDSVFRQWITDTSQGSENTSGQSNEGLNSIDGRVDVIDQYKRSDAFVAWNYSAMCRSCLLVATLGGQREDYRQAIEFDNQELYGELSLRYKRSRYSSVNAYYRYADIAFKNTNTDYNEQRLRLELTLDALMKKGRLRFYGEYSERQNDSGQAQQGMALDANFRAHLVGVAFDYLLYQR